MKYPTETLQTRSSARRWQDQVSNLRWRPLPLLLLLGALGARNVLSASYTITIPNGWSSVANQLYNDTNTLEVLLPNPNPNMTIY